VTGSLRVPCAFKLSKDAVNTGPVLTIYLLFDGKYLYRSLMQLRFTRFKNLFSCICFAGRDILTRGTGVDLQGTALTGNEEMRLYRRGCVFYVKYAVQYYT
jgi:hypothetical protein